MRCSSGLKLRGCGRVHGGRASSGDLGVAPMGSVLKPECGGGRLAESGHELGEDGAGHGGDGVPQVAESQVSRPAAAQALRHAGATRQRLLEVLPQGPKAVWRHAPRRHRRASLAKRPLLALYPRHGAGRSARRPGRASGTCALPHPQHARARPPRTEPAASPGQDPPAQPVTRQISIFVAGLETIPIAVRGCSLRVRDMTTRRVPDCWETLSDHPPPPAMRARQGETVLSAETLERAASSGALVLSSSMWSAVMRWRPSRFGR